jgi:thiosulfate/3-mercaptopyruvate sulfurtransferase
VNPILLPLLVSSLLGADTLLVSPAWLSAHLGEPGLVVIEAERVRAPYDSGHIAGSHFLALAAIVVERNGVPVELPDAVVLDSVLESVGIGDSSRIVITGDPLAAGRLFFTLDYLGMGSRTAMLDGGTPAWVAAGYPVSADPAPERRGSLTSHPRPGVVADAAWVEAHLHDSTVALLDARPLADYLGTAGSSPPSGHIPGAGNIFWRTTLGGAPPMLLPRATLEEMFLAANASPGKLVVTYCRTGVQASFLYFVARYLGYDVKMYDGSFAEWSQLAGAPIETGPAR